MLTGTTDVIPAGESPQLTSAIKAFTVLTREQKSALARTLDGFVDYLAVEGASPKVREVITEHAWHNRANWEVDDWEVWETWGWYRHWGRTVGIRIRIRSILQVTNVIFSVLTILAQLHEHDRDGRVCQSA